MPPRANPNCAFLESMFHSTLQGMAASAGTLANRQHVHCCLCFHLLSNNDFANCQATMHTPVPGRSPCGSLISPVVSSCSLKGIRSLWHYTPSTPTWRALGPNFRFSSTCSVCSLSTSSFLSYISFSACRLFALPISSGRVMVHTSRKTMYKICKHGKPNSK